MIKSYTTKRILAACMTLAMLLQMSPTVPAYAEDSGSEETVQAETALSQDPEQDHSESEEEPQDKGELSQKSGQDDSVEIPAQSDEEISAQSDEEISAQSDEEDSFVLTVNGNSAALGQKLTVAYGQPMIFALSGYTGTNTVMYYVAVPEDGTAPDDWDWKTISNGSCKLEPGMTYRLKYGVNIRNSSGTEVWTEGNSFSVTVITGTAAAPADLTWNGSVMSWSAVTTTSYGGQLDEGTVTGYTVTVYKNGAYAKTFTTHADTTSYVNFANNILDKNDSLGAGTYTFTVQAIINAGDHYDGSAVSAKSGSYIVPIVTVKAGAGIESVTPVESFILLPGNSDHNSQDISYTEKEGYTFSAWTADAGLSVADGRVTVSSNYSGAAEAAVTAAAVDTKAPEVTDPVKGSDYTVTASASDSETGVAAFAFSTAENAENVAASEWTIISSPAAGAVQESFAPAASGVYYFYAKDTNGNTARSKAISITRIELVNYYYLETSTDTVVYKIGDGTWTLPVPSCDGYVFTGWYENSDLSGTPVTQPEHNTTGTLTYYAGWTAETLTVPAVVPAGKNVTGSGKEDDAYTAVYDGQGITLSVDLQRSGILSYQWSRNGVAISGATGNSYTVKNTADSGQYSVTVTLTDRKGNVIGQGTADTWVKVTALKVTIRPVDLRISFGDDAPAAYTYTCTPAVIGDDALTDDTHPGTVACSYAKGSPAGTYTITAEGFDANSNYSVIFEDGLLTVSAKSADDDDSDISAAFADDLTEYAYTGSEIRPEVIVKDGDTVIASDNYSVDYSDNTEVGEAKAIITFNETGNYSGTVTLMFSVVKAALDASVTLQGWTYGDAANSPVVEGNKGGAEVTYEYRVKNGELWTNTSGEEFGGSSAAPVDAGTYEIIAKIAETDSYAAYTTNASEFTITPRTITLSSGSVTAPFDGKAHTNSETPSQEGSFAYAGEGFVSVSATGSRAEVGSCENTIKYELNDATDRDNYFIVCHPGTITITAVKLTCPSNAEWDSSKPGTASWIAVSKEGLTAQYRVQLYAKTSDGSFTAVGAPVTTENTSCDLSSLIRTDAADRTAEDTVASYSFTVTTLAVGENSGSFEASDESGKNGSLYTAVVTVNAAAANPADNSHVEGVEIHYANEPGDRTLKSSDTAVLIQGEYGYITARCEAGYELSYNWTVENAEGSGLDVLFTSVYTDGLTRSLSNVQLYPVTEDSEPWLYSFDAENGDDYSRVVVTFEAKDDVGLAGWMISESESTPAAGSSAWNSFTDGDGVTVTGSATDYTVMAEIRASGTYYLYVKDTAGNVIYRSREIKEPVTYDDGTKGFIITRVKDPFYVNAVTLAPGSVVNEAGETVDAQGESVTLYKLANTAITLPELSELGFSMEGYAFRNWFGTTGIYEINGKYSENKDDTLTANWTNEYHDYTVNYYYMNTDGSYSDTPDDTADYNVIYGTEITESTAAIQRPKDGFSVDTGKEAAITVTDDGLSIAVYYARNSHTLTRRYTNPGDTEPTVETSSVLYGADLSEALALPVKAGYTFVGWDFGSAKAADTMPDCDVTVTGEFVADRQTVYIRYFLETVDGTAYEQAAGMNREVRADTGSAIIESADEIEGFTYSSSFLTYGAEADEYSDAAEEALPVCAVDDSGSEIYLNLFYVRNLYTVTLNVWQGKVGEGDPAYTETWEDIPYGTDMTTGETSAQKMAEFAQTMVDSGKWTAEDGTVLAEYVDWSTGAAPETMPAGDVTITRQFVSDQDGEYQLEIWVEGDTSNTYVKNTFTYYGKIGAEIDIEDSLSTLSKLIDYNQYYHVRTVAVADGSLTYTDDNALGDAQGSVVTGDGLIEGTQLTGHVTDTNNEEEPEEPMVVRFFMERNLTSSTITYYYSDGTDNTRHKMAEVTKRVKWGHSYDYEPLALFDSGLSWSAESENVADSYKTYSTDNIFDPESYDFRGNNFVVSYSGYYIIYNGEHWPNDAVNTTAKLQQIENSGCSSVSTSYIMGQTANSMTVTYTKPTVMQYYLDVVYWANGLCGDVNGLTANKTTKTPLTYTDAEGNVYKIRIANEAMFYTDAVYVSNSSDYSYTAGEQTKYYPGLGLYNMNSGSANVPGSTGRFIYTTFDEDNYTAVEINGKTYYKSDSENYIYIPVSDNRFFTGNFTSYGYGTDEIGYNLITEFMAAYKAENAENSDTQIAQKSQSIYVYNRSWGRGTVYSNDERDRFCGGTLTIYFREHDPQYIYYRVNGVECTGHSYTYGTTVTEFSCTEHGLPTKPGYTLEWYTDSGLTKKATSLTMTTDHTLYGKFVKETYVCHEYAYYELADEVTLGDTAYSYITENDLAAFEDDALLTSTVSADGSMTTYYYNGKVVMIDTTEAVESFSNIAMDRTASVYVQTGLTYDAANPANCLKGYVETEAVSLCAYFKRDTYTLTIDYNNPKANNDTVTLRYGQSYTLADAGRNGYNFTGWTAEAEDGSTVELESGTTFACPQQNVTATAGWEAASLGSQNIIHYYQNSSLGFDTGLITAAMQEIGTAAEFVLPDGTSVSGRQYSNGVVSYTGAGGNEYYYSSVSDGKLSIEDLSAVVCTKVLTQDTEETVSEGIITQNKYNFAYVLLKTEDSIDKYTSGADTYNDTYGMTLEYYYTLEEGYSLTLLEYSTIHGNADSGQPDTTPLATLNGAGENYYYSQNVQIAASMPAGYTFIGWYTANDDGTPNSLITADAISSQCVKADTVLIAWIEASEVSEPELTVTGPETLTYGYEASKDNAITVKAVFSEDASTANYVYSYQWYEVTDDGEIAITKDDGGTSATYLIATGKNCGTYTYRCKVTVARKDNGLKEEYTSDDYSFTVTSGSLTAVCTNYSGIYDGTSHSVNVEIAEDTAYTIYYAEATDELTELTEENYKTSGSTEKPVYTDVCNVTVLYYVQSDDPNYSDAAGSGTVTITAKLLTLNAGAAVYSKVYDGAAEVSGEATDADSDLGRLAQTEGIYSVVGLAAADAASADIIDCTAIFNSSHTSSANVLTLSDITLIHADGTVNSNYYFADGYSISISGYITAMPLTLAWSGDELTYNGSAQGPEAVIETGLPDADNGNVSVKVGGSQTNIGTYPASANLVVDGGTSEITDFSLENGSHQFTIGQLDITVSPVTETVVYDGTPHTLGSFAVTDGSLADGQELISAVSTGSRINVGTTSVEAGSAVIKEYTEDPATGEKTYSVTTTNNYNISYGTADITIERRPVTVSGITSADKVYDGTTAAVSDVSGAVFGTAADNADSGLVKGDSLSIDPDEVSAAFDTADVGESKTVTFTLGDNALAGASAGNYVLSLEGSTLITTNSITQKEVTVTADDTTVVYGETAEFSFSYNTEDFIEADRAKIDELVSGSVTYKIAKQGAAADTAEPYSVTTDAGVYDLYVYTDGLSSNNYCFTAKAGTLTVAQRPVMIQAAEDSAVTKIYDGTTGTTAENKTALAGMYEFVSVDGNTASGLVNGDTVMLTEGSFSNSAYNYKNVNGSEKATQVTVSGLSSSNLSDSNYILSNSSFTVGGSITPKEATITADDKSVDYGNTADVTYTAKASGLAAGDDLNNAFTGLAFNCEYDPAQVGYREVRDGGYEITVDSGCTAVNGNYKLTLVPGTLTVNKAVITVTTALSAENATYSESSIPDVSFGAEGLVYGEDFADVVRVSGTAVTLENIEYTVPSLTEASGRVVTASGAYHFAAADRTSGTETKSVISTLPGKYTVQPVIDGFSADNYTITFTGKDLTIDKFNLKIDGITVSSRVYDGTTAVYQDQFDFSGAKADGLLSSDQSAFDAGKESMFGDITASYNSKDVVTANEITITNIAFGQYLSDRFYVATDCQTVITSAQGAAITRRPLSVTADNKSVRYGETDEYTVTYSGTDAAESGFVTGESADSSNVTISCTYAAGDDVGTYTIVPSAFTGSATADKDNYKVTYSNGTLTVTQNQLTAPEVAWDSENPGTVSWNKVDGIGKVAVERYTAVLYCDGSAVADGRVTVPAGDAENYSYDFSELIHKNGAGVYTVEVIANASEENNAGNKNVIDSNAGVSGELYAARVSFTFSDDTVTSSGKSPEKNAISITGKDNVTVYDDAATATVIAGESEIAIAAAFKNATGYTIKSVASDSGMLTVNGDTSTETAVGSYSGTVSMSSKLESTADITVTIALAPVKAELSVNVAADPASAPYGYTGSDVPQLSVVAVPADKSTGYTYTYEWQLYFAGEARTEDAYKAEHTGSSDAGADGTDSWSLPTGLKANDNARYYRVHCVVTAVRLDNGQKITSSDTWVPTASSVALIKIDRADCEGTISMTGWSYGDARQTPSEIDCRVEDNEMVNTADHTHYYYKRSSDADVEENWTSVLPTDAGEYQVKAVVDQSQNYGSFATNIVDFTISAVQLDTPEELAMSPSSTAPYGLISWDAVTGFTNTDTPNLKENAGAEDSESYIAVTYLVQLYKQDENGDYSVWKTYTTDKTELDITSDLQVTGKYYYTVTAKSSNTGNCADSAESVQYQIFMDGKITAQDTATDEEAAVVSEISKKYDGYAIILTAVVDGAEAYQWYKGTEPIPGATDQTLNVTHVDDSGSYTCMVTAGNTVYTPKVQVSISKRLVTMTSGSAEKIYDGTRIINNTVEVTGDGFAAGEGAAYTYTYTSGSTENRTDVGTSDNTFTYALNEGTEAGDYTVNTLVYGKLTITQRTITEKDFTVAAIDDVVYNDTAYTPQPSVTDKGLATETDTVLVKDTDYTYSYSNNTDAGTATVTITGKGNYTGSVTTTFNILKRPVHFVGSSPVVEYNGELQSSDTYIQKTVDAVNGVVSGHTATLTYLVQGTEAGSYNGTITGKDAVIIKAGERDVTANYDITTDIGVMTITPTKTEITITFADESYTYNGLKQSHTAAETDTLTGTDTILYSTDQSTWVSDIADLSVQHVAESTVIYVKVTNPNYANPAETSAKLTIAPAEYYVTTESGTKNYDGTALTKPGEIHGLVNGETATFSVTGTVTNVSEGTVNNTYSLSWTGTAAENDYVHGGDSIGTLTVSKAVYYVVTDTDSKAYDGTALTAGGHVEGLQNGETVSFSTTGTVTNVSEGTVNNTYSLEWTGSAAESNYMHGTDNIGTLKITERTIAQNEEFAFGEVADVVYCDAAYTPEPSVTDKGLAAGTDTVLVKDTDYTYSYSSNTDAGTATVTITGKGNYTGSVSITFEIAKRCISLIGETGTVIYNGSEQQLTNISYAGKDKAEADADSGVVSGHTVYAEYCAKGTEASDTAYVGMITAADEVIIMAGTRVVTDNYNIQVYPGSLTISRTSAEWTVSLADYETTYTGKAQYNTNTAGDTSATGETAYSYSFTENGTYVSDLSSLTQTDAGEYTIYVKAVNPNYSTTATTTAKLIIRPAPYTVTTGSASRAYNGSALTAEGTVKGLVNGETASVVTTSITDAGSTANNYTVKWDGTANSANYTHVEGDSIGTLTVSKAVYYVVTESASKPYDGTALTAGGQVEGLQNGETVSFSTTGTVTNVPEGTVNNTYSLEWTGTAAESNYTHGTDNIGTLKITARTIAQNEEFTFGDVSDVVYNGTKYTPTPSVTDKGLATKVDTALTEGTNFTYSYGANTNAGRATVTVTGIGNYTGSVEIEFNIAQRPVSFTGASAEVTYTGEEFSLSEITVAGRNGAAADENSGLVNGDSHNAVYSVSGTEADTYNGEITAAADIRIMSGAADVTGNYAIESTAGTLVINRTSAEWTVSLADYETTYTGKAQYNTNTAGDTSATGETAYSYSFTENGTYVSDLSSLTQTDAGEYTIYVKAVNPNYSTTATTTAKLIIDKAEITVITESSSRVYNGTALTAGGTMSELVNGETAVFTVTGTQTAVGSSDNSYSIAWTGTAKENNYHITETIGTLNVTEYAGTITVTVTGGSYVYDGQSHKATVEVSTLPTGYTLDEASSNAVLTHAFESSVTARCDTLRILNAQGIDVTDKLNISYTTDTLEITPRQISVVTENSSKVYNGTALTAGGTITGFVDGETATFKVTGSQTRVGSSDNTYSLLWNGTADSRDYQVNETIGKLIVFETSVSIIVTTTGGTFEYDGETHQATVEVSELPVGYTVETATSSAKATHVADGTVSATCDSLVIRNAQGIDVTEALGNNISYVNDTITIIPAVLTVVTESAGKTYDGTELTADGSISGFKHDETASFSVTGSQETVGNSDNTYSLVFDGTATESDYTISETIGKLTVSEYAEEITVTTSGEFVYDGNAHSAVVEVSELPAGYTLVTAASDTTAAHVAETPAAAHCNTLVIRNAEGIDVTDRLNISYVDKTLVITPAVLTITTPDAEKVYNGTELTAAGTITGFIGNETASFSTTGTQTEVGESDNTYSLIFDGSANESDYTIKETVGKLSITEYAEEITVTTVGGTYVYDAQIHEGSVKVSDLPEGYTLVSAETESKAAHVADGKVTVTVSGLSIVNAQGIDVTDKLNITVKEDGVLEITPAEITVVTQNGNKTYDGITLTAKGTITGFVGNDSAELVITGAQKNAGSSRNTYTIRWAENTASSDYTVNETVGTLTVARADVTVTVNNASKVYGNKDPEWTAQITGTVTEVDNKLIAFTITRSAGQNAGTYTLTANGEEAQGNYNVTFIGATFTIEKAPLEIIVPADEIFTYDAASHGSAASSNVAEADIRYSTDEGRTWTDKVPAITNAGTIAVMVKTNNSNYVTATGSYTVTVVPAEVTLTADNKSSAEGSTLKELTYTVTGTVYAGDTLGKVTVSTDAADKAGTYTIAVNVADANPNYSISTVDGVYTITAAGEKTPIDVPDGSIEATVPDDQNTRDKVLDDEDKKAEEEGETVQIRVVVDDQNTETQPEDIRKEVEEAYKPGDDTTNTTTEVIKVIDIDMEKKVGDSDWESAGNPNGTVQVEITVPELPDDRTGHYAIARIENGTVVPMDDLSDDPSKIVIETDDFDSEYVLVYIEDEEAPLANMSGVPCYWHWLQILLVLLCVIYLVLVKNGKLRALGMAVDIILGIIVAILGFCRLDWWFALGNLILVCLAAYLTRKKKSEETDEEAKA